MTRYAKGHKEATRTRILDVASRILLKHGFDGAGIDAIMAEAELTRGGFYNHFDSKEDLEKAVFSRVMELTRARLFESKGQHARTERSDLALERVVGMYLSEQHRDADATGCGLPALSSDVARRSADMRHTYEAELLLLVAALEARIEAPTRTSDDMPAFDRALALAALMAGGVALARAVKDKALSTRILAACRRFALR